MISRVKVIVLVGLPGSGKSTWAAGRRRATVLSSDAIRLLLAGDETDQSIHARVFATMRFLLRQRLAVGRGDTIIDATNLARKWRRDWVKIARAAGAELEAVFFDTPLEVCLARNKGRSRVVPEAALRSMASKLRAPELAEGFTRVKTIRASGRARRREG